MLGNFFIRASYKPYTSCRVKWLENQKKIIFNYKQTKNRLTSDFPNAKKLHSWLLTNNSLHIINYSLVSAKTCAFFLDFLRFITYT